MKDNRTEIMNSIWEKVGMLEMEREGINTAKTSRNRNLSKIPNKLSAAGACGAAFLIPCIFLFGEITYWITLCFVPVAYLIDKYSCLEKSRNRETELFRL